MDFHRFGGETLTHVVFYENGEAVTHLESVASFNINCANQMADPKATLIIRWYPANDNKPPRVEIVKRSEVLV